MWYRALKEFTYTNGRGEEEPIQPGGCVNIKRQDLVNRLLARGAIGPSQETHASSQYAGLPALPVTRTLRIGLWLHTSPHYSGGRIHMFQYAVEMAARGAEVFLITNEIPRWASDYQQKDGMKVLKMGRDIIPPDIDLIVTDSKTGLGKQALAWKRQHPRCPFICMNFETPNWIRQFCPKYADGMEPNEAWKIFPEADILLANSAESLKWLLEYVKHDKVMHTAVLPPAVNTRALAVQTQRVNRPGRPYAVWSARAAYYKGGGTVLDGIWKLDKPFDLVTFGSPVLERGGAYPESALHKHHSYEGWGDAEKFHLMAGAHVVLAPSLFEGFGMVPMEALASGTRALVYDLPVLRQVYGDRLEYVKWGDEHEYKQRLSAIAGAPREPAPQASKDWAIEHYGLEALGRRAEALPYHAVSERRLSAHMICYGTPTAPAAVEAVYPYAHEIVIAHGPTKLWQGWPDGGVLEALRAIPDPDGKIRIEARDVWDNKLEMRSWCSGRVSGNYMMMLDADEIWTGLDELMASDVDWGCPRWVNLWHGPGHWIYDVPESEGRRWGRKIEPFGSGCPHYRHSWWRPSYWWVQHHTPVDHAQNVLINRGANEDAARALTRACIYHLGHALPAELMAAKHSFYERRDGADPGRVERRKVWAEWDGKVGRMPDGIIEPVTWELPEIVQKAFALIGGTEPCLSR